MREHVTLTGMILVASPIKEYDKRIEILTKERGRISAFAQGARRPNSTLSACTIPFTFGEFQLYEGKNAYNLKAGMIQKYFGDIAQDYDALCYASYFSEMVQYLTRENIEAPEELVLFYMTMCAIQAEKIPLRLIRLIYEFRLMSIQGEGLEIFSCLRCGTEECHDVYFSEGGLICPVCAKKDKSLLQSYPFHLSADARYTLQYIITSRFESLYTFQVTEAVLVELEHFMKRYLSRYLSHTFKALEFLE